MIRQFSRFAKHDRGTSAIEFAFVAPMLMLLVIGIAKFGLVLNNYLNLTSAVATGARNLALSRGGTTPYTSTINQVQTAAINLVTGSLIITISINNAACNTNTACQTAITSASTGGAAAVTATYPCDLAIFGYDFAPGCTLSSSMTEMIE